MRSSPFQPAKPIGCRTMSSPADSDPNISQAKHFHNRGSPRCKLSSLFCGAISESERPISNATIDTKNPMNVPHVPMSNRVLRVTGEEGIRINAAPPPLNSGEPGMKSGNKAGWR